ncbi:Uncharacterized protein FWK35_00022370, partial [Aphis craccivora]
CLLLDEIKISKALSFQRSNLKIESFVGAFLRSGAVFGKKLEKLFLEAVILLENQNIHVDVVTTNEAAWNRNMWKLYGISDVKSSCTNPVNPERKFGSVAAAMQYYKDSIPALIDCNATIFFYKKINQVVDAMNSQLPKCALKPDPASIHNKVFDEETYQSRCPRTFFGSIRGACGSGTHPDSLLFIQVYRLLSTYSLVRPPKGSNISGETLLEAIISMPDILTEKNNERKKEIENKLDNIFDNKDNGFSLESDHNYTALPINPHALTVLAGYVTRKMRKIKTSQNRTSWS